MPSLNELNDIGSDKPSAIAEEVFVFPASFAQQRLWFLDKLEPGQNTYNVPFAIRLNGNLNQQALERTLQEIVNRHEVLRTTFSEDEAGKPIQLVAPEQKFMLAVSDLRSFPAESREQEARRHVVEHVRQPFDLKRGPLFRASLFQLADAECILSLSFHHIIVDGWSWGVVLHELSALYEAFSQGKDSPLAPLSIQYGDYATWQHDWLQGERIDNLLAYWKKQLSDAPPVLELPGDFPRPLVQTFSGAQESTMVPRSLQDALTELSQKEGVTLFMTLLSAFDLLLARYSGQNDIVVGTPISGRTRAELEGLIGFLVNTLPLRTDVSGNPTFREFLARVRETALQAYAHQDLPFERLVEELSPERDLSRSPIIQVLYIFEHSIAKQKSDIGDLEVAPFRGAEGTTAKFDMQFSALVNPSGMRLALTYNVDLFRPATVQRMLTHLQAILQAMVADPESRIGDLCLLNDAERRQLLAEFNSTEKEYRRDVLVHHLVEQQVQRNPEALAVAFNDEHLTYAQLNQRSNRLANYLRSTGIVPGSLVAICMERSLEMVVSVVAILKSGAAYVPLDPEYPKDRLAFMLEDSQAAVVLTQERIRGELDFGSTPVLCVDSAWNEISRHHAENPKNLATPEDLVYVIYTSGSTGKPKGVCLPHRCLTNLLYWQLESSQAVVGDRTLQFTSLSFDVSFQEIFSTLSSGGALVLISESTRRDGRALLKFLKEHSVGRLFQPFVALQQIAEAAYEEDDLPISLREVITAGEQLKVTQQIASFFERLPGCKLFNHYGPSETHVVTSYELSGNPVSWETLPAIGKPIANTQIFILDSNRNPVPLGVSGELYVGGISLARGYLRRPELTNERFVGNPFSTNSNDVLYRTGDLCRYLPDGNIQYLGRIDNQVKFRGYRIELGEIESALAKHSAVQQSAVILREDLPGDKRLVAYVVPRNGAINAPELRSHLKQTLPEYMVPSAFVQMEALPLTPSGKLSRRQLPVPEWDNTPSAAAAPRNPIEELLLGIWNDILRRKGFGVEDNFFDLGGHSLLATQLISRIRRTLQMDLPLRIVFEHPTIRELAHDIGIGRRASDADNSPRLVRRPRPTKAGEEPVFPLSFAEQRLWMLDRLDQNSSAYNLSVGLRLQGSLQVAALEHSWNEILRRHEVLRARFRFHGEQPEQVIAPEQPVSLPLTDLSDRANPEKEALELVRRESQKPFNLATGPLWRASLLKLAADEHVLLINVHHAVFDGWSGGVLLRELVAHYSAFVTGTPSRLPEPEIQYTDFAVWQREYLSGERLQRQVNYWKQQLEGAPGYIDLPADHSRPQKQRFHGSQLRLTIPADLSSKLKQVAQKNEATLFMTLLSAFSVLLARYSGQDDVVVGSPIAGRTHAETENLIGFFVNTIPLRAKVAGDSTFKQLLTSVRETTLNAYTYQDLPFEKLVEEIKPERDLSRNPIFQVMFALQNLPSETTELPELTLSPFRAGSAVNSKFDLSLMAVEQGDSISSVFEYNTDLFEAATIERMSRSFHALLTAIAENPNRALSDFPLLRDPLQVIPRTEPLRTSLAQERLWFVDQLEPQSPLHNLPLVLRLTGPLDVRALRNSLNRILARHECLRTWFKSNKAGAPVQMITPALEVDLRVNSVTSVPERVRETEARQLVSAEVNSSFDLGTGPLIRVLLVKISARDHVLVVNLHRIISDRTSMDVLRNEIVRLYQQEVAGDVADLAPLPIQYADFAAWQRQSLSGEVLQQQLRYWKQKLRGVPASLDLPIDRPRPPEQSYEGARSVLEIPRDLTEQLLAMGRSEGATLFVTLLASFKVLLSRYSGQDDIVVGSPVAGRSLAELESLIGLLANNLVLRTQVVGKESFRQLLRNVCDTVMEAYAHQDLPFERLVEALKPERDLSRTPLFQVMFAVENGAVATETTGGLEIRDMEVASAASRFDLTVTAAEQESGIRLRFEYATALFDELKIQQIQRHWLTLLQDIVANPDCAVADLPLLSDAERNEILHEWNATDREFERSICMHDLVARRAASTPDAVAVEMGGEQLTYAELNTRADRLAQYLRAKGLTPEALVGIYLERSIDMVVALLGTLKAGGAYVPLDPAYPADRIAFIAEDAQLSFLLTQPELARRAPAHNATVIDIRAALKAGEVSSPVASQSLPEHLAYVLYTSGSTGKPKGVQITHGNLTNFLWSMQREPGFTASDSLLAVTTLSFDIAALELYLPLISGGRVILASREDAADARALRYLLEQHRPTVMQATPATWRMLIESGWEGAPDMKVLCGGEALPSELALQLVPRCAELWNMYGPTETTVWSSVQWVRDVAGTAPIGRPIANTTFYILDSRQQPVPIGVAGELYIGGEGVARGYLNRPELTAERFLRDPFSKKEPARMYRTGDLVRYLRDGTVQYLGRTDFQVKVRGFRIELGEIENQLAKHAAVQQAIVAAREDVPGDKRLVAYVVPKPGEHLSLAECRTHLRQSLPDYMVPSAVVELTALPLTPNGKVDRKALPKPTVASDAAAGAATAPRDALEKKLLALWKRVLNNSSMGVTDNFFDLGGHSLMAAQLMSEIENSLGRRIPMAVLFRGQTVADMAAMLRDGTESSAEPIAMRVQPGRTTPFFAVVAPDMDSIGYAALAQFMGSQQTFYKLQLHRAVKPDAPITLDEMRVIARDYVQAMKTVQPRGPYYIGGMCAGTHIGEQMILQLEAEGEKVAMFAIFDTWVRQNSHVRWKWKIYYYRQRLRSMLRMSFRKQLQTIGDALSKKLRRVATMQKPVQTSFARLYWPGKEFKTPHFKAPVALFKRPKQPFYYIKDETMGWSERSQGGVHIYRIDFPHQMLREPYIRDVAKRLLECISRATPAPVEKLQVWPKVSHPTPAIDVEG